MLNNEESNEQLSFGQSGAQVLSLSSLLEGSEQKPNNEEPIGEESNEEVPIPGVEEVSTIQNQTIDSIIDPVSSPFKEMYERMVNLKQWEPIEALETEDGVVNLDELEFDEELFNQIALQQEEFKKQTLLANKVETTQLSDFTKKLIEIEKSGGDVNQALEIFKAVKEPLQSLDLSVESDQIAAIQMQLSAKGVAPDIIPTIIEGYKAKDVLEEKSLEAKSDLDQAYEVHMNNLAEQAKEARRQQEEGLKVFRKELSNRLSTTFQINDSTRKQLVDIATKKENGKYVIDELYNTKRKDVNEAAELAFFLSNKEEYLKQKFDEHLTNTKVGVMKKFKFIKNTGTSLNIERQRGNVEDEIDLDTLK